MNFKTQLFPGYEKSTDSVYKSSNFMSPAYVIVSAGMDYKPNDNFSLMIAPLSGKITIVVDEDIANIGKFTGKLLSVNDNWRFEFGGVIMVKAQGDIIKKYVLYKTKLDLFSNYAKDPQYIDVDWEFLLALKLGKYVTANFKSNLLYDHDIKAEDGKAKIQFKEIAGIGFTLKF